MHLLHRKKNGIYANISLSYSKDNLATRSSLYPDQMVDKPEFQQRLRQLDEPQRQIPSEDPVT